MALVLTATAAVAVARAQQATRYDLIIRHGTLVDGTGGPRFQADVAVTGDRVVAIGDLSSSAGAAELEARGLVVAPGFVNIHSHATAEALPTAVNMLVQGVTTEIIGADGRSDLDVAGGLTTLASRKLAVNVGSQVGFNSVWAEVVGQADRRPSPADVAKMRSLVETNLKAGAWGVSAGLDYKPGYFARAAEVVQVVSVAGPWRTYFPNHDRLTPETGFSSKLGIGETLTIGKESGLVPVVTHMKVQGHEQGSADAVLASMRAMSASGTWVAADAYPYLAGQTALGALTIPGWALEGGIDKTRERFKDPALRARIVKEAEDALEARFGGRTGAGVYLPGTGEQLTAVMAKLGVSAGEAIVRLNEREMPSAILTFGLEADLVKILQYPATSIACDCGASSDGHMHPRYWGTYPRVFGRYVRETGALTLEDAVRKSSALPAATVGLVDRGILAVGMLADIAVFDAQTITDHATYEQPTLPPDGMRHVIVNGAVALRDGRATGAQAGRALLRTSHMPSRMTTGDGARSVAVSGTLESGGGAGAWRIEVAVTQAAGARAATGTVRLVDPSGRQVVSTRLGVLQTMKGWATVSGLVRVGASGEAQPFTLVIDLANPLEPKAGQVLVFEGAGVKLDGAVKGTEPARVTPAP